MKGILKGYGKIQRDIKKMKRGFKKITKKTENDIEWIKKNMEGYERLKDVI